MCLRRGKMTVRVQVTGLRPAVGSLLDGGPGEDDRKAILHHCEARQQGQASRRTQRKKQEHKEKQTAIRVPRSIQSWIRSHS